MWRQRMVALVRQSPHHLILKGGEAYGVEAVFEQLAAQGRTAWVMLEPPDTLDGVSLGNALASTVNRALGSVFLPLALPYSYHLEVLKTHPEVLDGLTILVSRAGSAPQFAKALLTLPPELCRVVLDYPGAPEEPPSPSTVVPPEALALSLDEALAEGQPLGCETITALWRATRGAYGEFQRGLHRLTGRPPPTVPTPTGGLLPLGDEQLVDPGVFLDVLLSQKRYIEALDVACRHLPERVREVVPLAGPVYQEHGLLLRLFLSLRSLDDEYLQDEATLEWLLVGAAGSGHLESTRPLVQTFLSKHEAPQLRARYVGAIANPQVQRAEAKQLAQTHPSAMSLFQWGRLHPDPQEGAKILEEAVRLAEQEGRPYDAVRNAGALATRLIHIGAFKAALSWCEWALRKFNLHGLHDGRRRLLLVNNWAYARIIDGQLSGLRDELWRYQQQLEGVLPDVALLYRETLSQLELVLGDVATAVELARSNVWQSPRRWIGEYAVTLVRTLLELERYDEALKEATLAFDVSRPEGPSQAATLALGMALALKEPERAAAMLEPVMNDPLTPAEYRCSAALYFLLASKRPFHALPSDVQALFKDVSRYGLHLFSGPEHRFRTIWAQVIDDDVSLRIETLGTREVRLHGEKLELTPFLVELLTILALHPQGLSPQQLHTHLYPEARNRMANVKMNISRLRKLVPITPPPYRIDLDYRLDALELERLIDAGALRQALALYGGPFLEESEIPLLAEHRAYLEDLLRQAVLQSDDPEVLVSYAQLAQDPEVWEVASGVLERLKDPRLAVAKATMQRLYRELEA